MDNQEYKSIGKLISIIHRQFQIYINSEISQFGLNSSEYIYLVNLGQNEGVNQKYLSDELIIDGALTTRVMKSLEKKGYIIRLRSEEDKRSYIIQLSDKGKEIQPIILEKLQNWTKILSVGMNEDEINDTIQKLKQMSENVMNHKKGGIYE